MQSRSGNKCHLQCPQQANAIAKPNLRRYLALWSTARAAPHLPRCVPSRRRLSPDCAPPTPAVLQETLSGLLHGVHLRLDFTFQHLLQRSIGCVLDNFSNTICGLCRSYQKYEIVLSYPQIGSLSSSTANQRAAQRNYWALGFALLKLCYL